LPSRADPTGLADKKIVALIAYLQRLGTDITKPEPQPDEAETGPGGHSPSRNRRQRPSADELEDSPS
jgi:hypothetical protein